MENLNKDSKLKKRNLIIYLSYYNGWSKLPLEDLITVERFVTLNKLDNFDRFHEWLIEQDLQGGFIDFLHDDKDLHANRNIADISDDDYFAGYNELLSLVELKRYIKESGLL